MEFFRVSNFCCLVFFPLSSVVFFNVGLLLLLLLLSGFYGPFRLGALGEFREWHTRRGGLWWAAPVGGPRRRGVGRGVCVWGRRRILFLAFFSPRGLIFDVECHQLWHGPLTVRTPIFFFFFFFARLPFALSFETERDRQRERERERKRKEKLGKHFLGDSRNPVQPEPISSNLIITHADHHQASQAKPSRTKQNWTKKKPIKPTEIPENPVEPSKTQYSPE